MANTWFFVLVDVPSNGLAAWLLDCVEKFLATMPLLLLVSDNGFSTIVRLIYLLWSKAGGTCLLFCEYFSEEKLFLILFTL